MIEIDITERIFESKNKTYRAYNVNYFVISNCVIEDHVNVFIYENSKGKTYRENVLVFFKNCVIRKDVVNSLKLYDVKKYNNIIIE